ncbi:MAG: hypothetical protein LBF68_06355 [Christensenellaceae bacterium]|jgi:hypothetical protein|nr:hypothetical protein [Christensenellaceae bacterium]
MKKKFIVTLITLLIMTVLLSLLVACVPSDPEKAKEKMSDLGYKSATSLFGLMNIGDAVDGTYHGVKDSDSLFVIWFKNKDDAKEFEGAVQELIDSIKDNILFSAIDTSKYEYKRSGKVVYFGTEQAIKDFQSL